MNLIHRLHSAFAKVVSCKPVSAAALRRLGIFVVVGLSGCAAAGSQSANQADSEAVQGASIHFELAQGYFQRGQFQVALGEVNAALQDQPSNADAYAMRALIETALIEPQQATVDYREALNLAPHNPDILQDYGWFLCSHKHYSQSFPLFHQSLLNETGDQAQKTYLALGVCQYRVGNLRQATQTLTHGLAIFPGDPALQTNLAMALDRAGNASGALQRIRSVDYGSAATPESLWIGILIAHKLHDTEDAEQWSSQLNDHDPNNPWTALSKRRAYDDTSIFTY